MGSSKFTCPCCGYRTLDEQPPGTYQVCPICLWEDDQIQFQDPDYRGGANSVSLREAQDNFRRFGASEQRFRQQARSPSPAERRDPEWRPLSQAGA
jgi:hypothetical protein